MMKKTKKIEIVIFRTTTELKALLKAEATKRTTSTAKLLEEAFLAFLKNEEMK